MRIREASLRDVSDIALFSDGLTDKTCGFATLGTLALEATSLAALILHRYGWKVGGPIIIRIRQCDPDPSMSGLCWSNTRDDLCRLMQICTAGLLCAQHLAMSR